MPFLILVALDGVAPSFAVTAGATTSGYGVIAGHIGPCPARTFDASGNGPMIVVLMRNGRTLTTYDVSADGGTASYHFDVPVGNYTLATTWPRTNVVFVTVKLGKTTILNIHATCAPANL